MSRIGPAPSEDDLVNDETFGDIGDIRAGDAASELLWAPNHDALAKKIEAEKEAILRARQNSNVGSTNSVPLRASHNPQEHVSSVRSRDIPQSGMSHVHGQQLFSSSPEHMNTDQHNIRNLRQNPVFSTSVQSSRTHANHAQLRHATSLPTGSRTNQNVMQGSNRNGLNPPPPIPPAVLQAQLEALVRIQQQDFVKQNSGLSQDQLRILLTQYHEHFVVVAMGRIRNAQMAAYSSALQSNTRSSLTSPVTHVPGLPHSAVSVSELESSMRNAHISVTPTKRQLPTMNEKDFELVLRMHLRQLETSIPHRDDYYNVTYRAQAERDAVDEAELSDRFEELGTNLSARIDVSLNVGSKPLKERSSRKKRERASKKNAVVRSAAAKNANLKTLTNVLGTVQAWNPKSQRRVMDMQMPAANGKFDRMLSNNGDGERRLMSDDDRIRARTAVEDGYDIIGQLHDLVQGHASYDAQKLLAKLVSTLGLAKSNYTSLQNDTFSSFESMRFFVRMCMFEKGKRYVSRVLSVLPSELAAQILVVVFENLSMLLYAVNPTGGQQDVLWSAFVATVQKPDFPARSCMNLLTAFSKAHVTDSGSLIIALSSDVGAKLLYTALQRIFSAQNDDNGVDLIKESVEWCTFCDAITERLGDAFVVAESSANIWQVAAMLDALSEGPSQATLRSTLKDLLDTGRAPPPPVV